MPPIPAQLPPITFSVDPNGEIRLGANAELVTSLGDVTVDGNNVTNSAGEALPPSPAGATQLIICQQGGTGQPCKAYQIGTSLPVRVEVNGFTVSGRIIEAAPGSTINVTADRPSTALGSPGPAAIDLKEFYFEETGQHTMVDLERSGTTADLSYDHITGVLTPINRTRVSLYDKSSWWWEGEPGVRSDYPGEQQCRDKPDEDWRDAFSKDDLEADFSIYCIQTADSFGFLYIKPIENQKPNAYYVYAYTWIR